MDRSERTLYLQLVVLALVILGAAGCSKSETSEKTPPKVTTSSAAKHNDGRWYTPPMKVKGKRIYKENCATCHGNGGEGAFGWQRGQDDEGKYLAPPLNGSGHSWHHPLPAIQNVVKKGGPGGMPAWGEKLSDEERNAVIAYFQSLWPNDIYQRWENGGKHKM